MNRLMPFILLLAALAITMVQCVVEDGSDSGGDSDSDSDSDSDGDSDSDSDTDSDSDSDTDSDTDSDGDLIPPAGGSSGGSGGSSTSSAGTTVTVGGLTYRIIATSSIGDPAKFMLVYSGTEGGAMMMQNIAQFVGADYYGMGSTIVAILSGDDYFSDGAAGAADGVTVIDDVRSKYNVDNDRTYLLSESAGTTSGLEIGFHVRQSYFAAFWANDVNAQDSPGETASELGFEPWGNAGPGGDFPDANAIVLAMDDAGYRLPSDAPYSGTGASIHGSPEQFMAAIEFFDGKSRF